MNKQTDVFLVHGVAKTIGPEYYDAFVAGIRKLLPMELDVLFHPVEYSHLLEAKEDQIFDWMKDLPYRAITEFAAYYIADALAYAYPRDPATEGDFIYDVHKLLADKFAAAGRPGSRRVIIGHSLGSIVGYGFTWDVEVDCAILMGSPFFYFSPRFKGLGRMNPNLRQLHNFWKAHDKVSTGPLSKNPTFACAHDYQVTSLNPKYLLPLQAHSIYWTSEFVHKQIAKILLNVI